MSHVSAFDALFGGNNGTLLGGLSGGLKGGLKGGLSGGLRGGEASLEALEAGGPTRASKYCPKGEVPDKRKGRHGRCRHVSHMRKNRSHKVCAPGSVRDRRKGRSGCRSMSSFRHNKRHVPREITMLRGPRVRSGSPGVSMTKYYKKYMKDRKKSLLKA